MQFILKSIDYDSISTSITLLFHAWKQGNQIFILGNGGSAATASHLANDLSKATIVPGKPRMRVIGLTDNTSLITAWANDSSFEEIFKEQLENLLQNQDTVLAISASGNSPNAVRAIEYARRRGAVTIGWTGMSGGRLKEAAEYCLHVPSEDVGMIESVHLVLDHLVTSELRRRISEQSGKYARNEQPIGACPNIEPARTVEST